MVADEIAPIFKSLVELTTGACEQVVA